MAPARPRLQGEFFHREGEFQPVNRLTRLWLLCATVGFAVAVGLYLLASLLMDGRS
jgi:hypothetical protein